MPDTSKIITQDRKAFYILYVGTQFHQMGTGLLQDCQTWLVGSGGLKEPLLIEVSDNSIIYSLVIFELNK